MKKQATSFIWMIPAALLFAAGFVVATFWDLSINQAIFTPNNTFAILMEAVGWYPAFAPPFVFLALLLSHPREMRKPWVRPIAIVGITAGFCSITHAGYVHFVHRDFFAHPADWRAIVFFTTAAAGLAILIYISLRANPSLRKKMEFFVLWGTVFLAANQIFIYPLKLFWQRTRFDDMHARGSFADFTPWFQPMANGGSSFPSGHTANAAAVFLVIVLCDAFSVYGGRRFFAYLTAWAYTASMGFARILIGRHFLSDTLAASGLMALLLFAMRRTGFYQKSLCKLHDFILRSTNKKTSSEIEKEN